MCGGNAYEKENYYGNAVTEITKADTEVELKAHVEGDWITDTEAGYDKAGAKHKECVLYADRFL